MRAYHIPVLLEESIAALSLSSGGIYADVTLGGGGHTREILSGLDNSSTLIVMDMDSDALANAPKDKRLILVHNNFRFLGNYLKYYGIDKLDGVLADLGVSSHQFDTKERGFSFRFDSPLDMRMNKKAKQSAAQIINTYNQEALASLFFRYGELQKGRELAKLICEARINNEINTTEDLREVLKPLLPKHAEHKFLAKVYQALRIEVNSEMKALELFLTGLTDIIKPGGRVVIITYHSLEDRMVKNFMRSGNINGEIDKDIYGRYESPFRVITKKPVLPSEEEISLNTRARSAKLRVAEKI